MSHYCFQDKGADMRNSTDTANAMKDLRRNPYVFPIISIFYDWSAHIFRCRNSECLNYLNGVQGDVINVIIAAAFNFNRRLNQELQKQSDCVQKMTYNLSESNLGYPFEWLSIN